MDWRDDVWQRFRKDLPGLVLIWVALTVIAIAIEVLGGDRRSTTALATGLGVIVLGVAAALIPVAVFSLPARILPLRHVGLGFGIISTCLNIGITIGPCMVGIARDLVGGYYTGFVMMAVFSFLSLATIALLKVKQ